jgi:hypothetical protein
LPSRLRAGASSGDVGDCVGVGVMTLFRLNAPIPRSAFLRIFVVQLEVLGGLVQEVYKGRECPVSIPSGGWQEAETLTLNRGLSRPGVAETPLFNNVRTVLVRGGHLGLDDALVKKLQQVVILDHLVVPAATLDSEL